MKILHGLIPICVKCKRIRTDQGARQRLEDDIHDHSDAEFSHAPIPDPIHPCTAWSPVRP